MEIRIENADTPQMKNCYIDTENFSMSGGFMVYLILKLSRLVLKITMIAVDFG